MWGGYYIIAHNISWLIKWCYSLFKPIDVKRVYDSKPTQDENAARYIAFAISQGLSPLDRDPSTPSKPIMPPFKTIKLSKLRKALQEDEFFFER